MILSVQITLACFPSMPKKSNSSLAIEDAVSHVSFKKMIISAVRQE